MSGSLNLGSRAGWGPARRKDKEFQIIFVITLYEFLSFCLGGITVLDLLSWLKGAGVAHERGLQRPFH